MPRVEARVTEAERKAALVIAERRGLTLGSLIVHLLMREGRRLGVAWPNVGERTARRVRKRGL